MKNGLSNLILTLVVFLTTVLSEILFLKIEDMSLTVPLKNYLALFITLFLFSLTKNKIWRIISMNMIIGFSFFQMMHLKFYGVPVYPNAIYLMFTESSEMMHTLVENLTLFFLPLLLIGPSLFLNIFVDKKISQKINIPFFHFLFLFYFLFNPIRTFATGNTWGRQPSSEEFLGTNIYLSLSYFGGRILPAKVFGNKDQYQEKLKIKLSSGEKFQGNIILVLGESLSANHLSLLGYERETTPFLDRLKSDPDFNYYKGISSGVSTDVAVALFMNNAFGLSGIKKIIKGDQCLFKLAKNSQFNTHFYSSQSQQQLRYITNSICTNYIDHYKSLDDLNPEIDNPNKADDKILYDDLDEVLTLKQQFIILHQRGSHSPYKLRYTEEKFPLVGDYKKDRVNHYDNSVYEFNRFMEGLIGKVRVYDHPTLVIYISDHGEGLGEEGVWGHAALKAPSYKIPILFFTHNFKYHDLKNIKFDLTHLHVSLLISNLLGFQTEPKWNIPLKEYTILGNDLDGFAGFLELKFNNEGKVESVIKKDI